jgi:hypothetical protein
MIDGYDAERAIDLVQSVRQVLASIHAQLSLYI